MSYECEIYDGAKHREEISRWWVAHGWPVLPAAILPPLGIVVKRDGVPHCAMWVYMAVNCGVCQMEWLTSNPACEPMRILRAISFGIEFLANETGTLGYHTMLTCCRQPELVKLYERNGFMKTDEGVTNLMMILRKESV